MYIYILRSISLTLTLSRRNTTQPVLSACGNTTTGESEAGHHLHDHQDGLPVHVRHPLGEGALPRQDQRADDLRHHHPGIYQSIMIEDMVRTQQSRRRYGHPPCVKAVAIQGRHRILYIRGASHSLARMLHACIYDTRHIPSGSF